jgi:hypothetical protein
MVMVTGSFFRWRFLMTRDEMIQKFTDMIDRAYENGWDEGYRRGLEDQDA